MSRHCRPLLQSAKVRLTVVLAAFAILTSASAQTPVLQPADVLPLYDGGLPPAAELVLPETSVQSGGSLLLDLVSVASLADVTVTLSEQGVSEPSRRLQKALPALQRGASLALKYDLPSKLERASAQRTAPAGKTPFDSKLFLLEVSGTLPDGQQAYSGFVIAFAPLSDGSFEPLTLSDYLTREGFSGALDVLPPEGIDPQAGLTLVSGTAPEPVAEVGQVEAYGSAEASLSAERPNLKLAQSYAESSAQGTVTVNVNGYVYYKDSNNAQHPLAFAEIGIWEVDVTNSGSISSLVGVALTDANGRYQTTVSHQEPDNTLEIFLRTKTINTWVSVEVFNANAPGGGLAVRGDAPYEWNGPTLSVINGGTQRMDYVISDSRKGAAQLFEWLVEASDFTRTAFNPGASQAVWPSNGTTFCEACSDHNYNYNLRFAAIYANRNSHDVAYHEYGHLTMYRRNGYRAPNSGGGHDPIRRYLFGLAWSEGWATAYAQFIRPDGYYDAANFPNERLPVENAREGTDCGPYALNTSTEHNEMWVAAALNDFYDTGEPSGGDDPANRIVSFYEMTELIRLNNLDSILEFYDRLLASSYLTQQEKNYASRVMRYNNFNVPLVPATPPPSSPPSAPTGFNLTGSPGQNPRLTWNATSGATGYKIYRCMSTTSCTNFTYLTSTSSTSYTDLNRTVGSSCSSTSGEQFTYYYVKAYNSFGTSPASTTKSTCTGAGKSDIAAAGSLPTVFDLHANYPNPFNPSTEIRFDLPEAANVRLTVYDALGREVARLVDGPVGAGYQHATFEASGLPSGVYLYRLEAKGGAETFAKTGQMVLVK